MTLMNVLKSTEDPVPPREEKRRLSASSLRVCPHDRISCLSLWPTATVSSLHDLPTWDRV